MYPFLMPLLHASAVHILRLFQLSGRFNSSLVSCLRCIPHHKRQVDSTPARLDPSNKIMLYDAYVQVCNSVFPLHSTRSRPLRQSVCSCYCSTLLPLELLHLPPWLVYIYSVYMHSWPPLVFSGRFLSRPTPKHPVLFVQVHYQSYDFFISASLCVPTATSAPPWRPRLRWPRVQATTRRAS